MTTVLLFLLIVSILTIAAILIWGFIMLGRRMQTRIECSIMPEIGAMASDENQIAIVNIGTGTAINVEWRLSSRPETGRLSFLTPLQTWHIRVPEQSYGSMSVTYKNISGQTYSCIFIISEIAASYGNIVQSHPRLVDLI